MMYLQDYCSGLKVRDNDHVQFKLKANPLKTIFCVICHKKV